MWSTEDWLHFACEQVLCCARQGDGEMPAASNEVVITYPVFQMVIAALKRKEEHAHN